MLKILRKGLSLIQEQIAIPKVQFAAHAGGPTTHGRRLLDIRQRHYPCKCVFAPAASCVRYHWPLIDSLGAASMQRWHRSDDSLKANDLYIVRLEVPNHGPMTCGKEPWIRSTKDVRHISHPCGFAARQAF